MIETTTISSLHDDDDDDDGRKRFPKDESHSFVPWRRARPSAGICSPGPDGATSAAAFLLPRYFRFAGGFDANAEA